MQELRVNKDLLNDLEEQAMVIGLPFARLWVKGYYWYCKLYNIPNSIEEMQDYYKWYVLNGKSKQGVDVLKNEMDGETYVSLDNQFKPFGDVNYGEIIVNKVYSDRF